MTVRQLKRPFSAIAVPASLDIRRAINHLDAQQCDPGPSGGTSAQAGQPCDVGSPHAISQRSIPARSSELDFAAHAFLDSSGARPCH
jgi:hypothetical protein